MFIDTHCHLDDKQYSPDLEQVLARAATGGVKIIINPGSDLAGSRQAVVLAKKYPQIKAAIGLHPHCASEDNIKEQIKILADLAKNPVIIAIGECGLEKTDNTSRELLDKQAVLFKRQLDLACQLKKPVILHIREAHEPAIEILGKYAGLKGVVHCFSGSLAEARPYLDLGLLLSFTGIITYTDVYDKIIQALPLAKIMLETDGPYLAPEPFRGQRNEPGYLNYVAEKIAKIKKKGLNEIAAITSNNALKLFNL